MTSDVIPTDQLSHGTLCRLFRSVAPPWYIEYSSFVLTWPSIDHQPSFFFFNKLIWWLETQRGVLCGLLGEWAARIRNSVAVLAGIHGSVGDKQRPLEWEHPPVCWLAAQRCREPSQWPPGTELVRVAVHFSGPMTLAPMYVLCCAFPLCCCALLCSACLQCV